MSDSTLLYNNFIGIDIGKIEFCVTLHGSKKVSTYKNTPQDIERFYQTYQDSLASGLVVLETTGGYELMVIQHLQSKAVAVHRAHARQVKSFIRSHGVNGKSDKIDATALALYACERHTKLKLYEVPKYSLLKELSDRRLGLIKIRTQEKNRIQAPSHRAIHDSYAQIGLVINEQLALIEAEMENKVSEDPELSAKIKAIIEIPGIQATTARALLATLPELGTINQKQIASLAGLAPHPKQSGTKDGYRRTSGGRQEVKHILYMPALSAARSKSRYGNYYRDLVERGKKPIVAIVALMRKMVIVANSKIKDIQEVVASEAQVKAT